MRLWVLGVVAVSVAAALMFVTGLGCGVCTVDVERAVSGYNTTNIWSRSNSPCAPGGASRLLCLRCGSMWMLWMISLPSADGSSRGVSEMATLDVSP